VRFLRQNATIETATPVEHQHNIVFEVFICRDNYSRASNTAPDFTWRIDWDEVSSDVHPLMLCPVESRFFMRGYLTEMPSNIAGTGDNTGTERRCNDIFATTFDLVTYDTGTADGTDEVFLFADEYLWVFNLVDKTIASHLLKTAGTHFDGEQTFPERFSNSDTGVSHCGVNASVDCVKGGWFAYEPITWGATHFTRPQCDDEEVDEADLDGIFAIAHSAGDKYFGIWLPQGDPSRLTFRYLGHKSNVQNHYDQSGGYLPPTYTTIDLVAHEVTPYNTVYCSSFDASTSTPVIVEDTNEKEHFPDDPVLLFAWTDYQYSSLTKGAVPTANTSLLLLPTDTETVTTSSAEYSRNFSRFLNGGDFWTEYFSKDDDKANNIADYGPAGSTNTVVIRPEIGAFSPSADVASSMIYYDRRFFTYAGKKAGSQGTVLQYYYELTDQDGQQFTDDLFRVTGNPVVNDLADGSQKLWFLAWVESTSTTTSRNYDWQLFNIGCKWVTTGDTKEIDGAECQALRLQPVIDWGGRDGWDYSGGAAAGIAPYPVPYPILKYERSYANATDPTILWTVSAPTLDADSGLTWYQYVYDAPEYTSDAITWSAPSVMLEAPQSVKDGYSSLIQRKLSLTSSTVTGQKCGFGYLCRDYLKNKDSYRDNVLGDTFTEHEDNAQVTFAYLPVDSHVYSVILSDGTEVGEVTISKISQSTTIDEESGEETTIDETYHYRQMSVEEYQMRTGGMANVANVSSLYSSVEGDPSSYVNVPRSYVIEQDDNKDNYAKATISSDAASNVAKYFNGDATNLVIGKYEGWNETYDEEWFNTYPLSYSSAQSYVSNLHATNDGVCWTPEGTDAATATVTWKDGLRVYSYLPMEYEGEISYTGLQIRPVWYLASDNYQQWNASDWMVLQKDASLICNLALTSSVNTQLDDGWEYGHGLNVTYTKSYNVVVDNETSLYCRIDGDAEWTNVNGGVTSSGQPLYHRVTLTNAQRDALMEKGIYSVYAYYKVKGTYTTTDTTSARMAPEDDEATSGTPFESNEVKVFLFSYTSTGVELVDTDGRAVQGPLYDLLGRKVEDVVKPGIYITGDGRKVKI
ncbi:MAG: hypothetical protein LIP02_14875, partial [Bacteroidales bacterium]|nr:hypothetical protein [Bacteroidales bacterium]